MAAAVCCLGQDECVGECMLPDETALSCHVQAGLRDPTLQSRHLGWLLATGILNSWSSILPGNFPLD